MFIGHYAVGLASKKLAPRASLGVLVAASILLDLLWPIFLLLGWERVYVEPNSNPFLRFSFDYPISHGLVAVVGWATLFAALYYGFTRYGVGSLVIWSGVISHWVLDYIVHRPDLPLYSGSSRLLGLGLWNHRWAAIAVEVALFVIGIWIYLRQTRARDSIGTYAFWGFVVMLLLAYAGAAFGPAPPASIKKIALATLGTAVLIPWAWWIDRHRESRSVEP